MITENSSLKYIFGLKVRELRLQKDLSFQELSDASGLSVSYLSEIEKGKKYPKGEKIISLANALDASYDYLVSLKVPKKIEPVAKLLQSNFLREFPLEMFGLDPQKIIEMVSNAPEKITAFLSTIMQIARNYEMRQDLFYHAALRSYQEMNDNYFPELEQAVVDFRKKHEMGRGHEVSLHTLENLLSAYGITIRRAVLQNHPELHHLRSFYKISRKELLLGNFLSPGQEKFLIARELAFQFLQLRERPEETPPQEASTFEELLNNYKASYFSAALLMEKKEVIKDIRHFAGMSEWREEVFLDFLSKYEATPEMLMQRLTNILPKYFGIHNLFFLRFLGTDDFSSYELTKELHLSRFHNPHANQLNEHYCRRWISIGIIKNLRSQQKLKKDQQVMTGVQISKYWQTPNQYLCLAIAKPNETDPRESISVTIGFLVDAQLRRHINFLNDPKLISKTVNTTCERCSITDCNVRMAPPTVIEQQQKEQSIRAALQKIRENN
ncbi:MAG: helix-turn-helix domain-containing protein [Cyclobacteriaceae bacterium]